MVIAVGGFDVDDKLGRPTGRLHALPHEIVLPRQSCEVGDELSDTQSL